MPCASQYFTISLASGCQSHCKQQMTITSSPRIPKMSRYVRIGLYFLGSSPFDCTNCRYMCCVAVKTNLTLKSTVLLVTVSVLHAALEIRYTVHFASLCLMLLVQLLCEMTTLHVTSYHDQVDRVANPCTKNGTEDSEHYVAHDYPLTFQEPTDT